MGNKQSIDKAEAKKLKKAKKKHQEENHETGVEAEEESDPFMTLNVMYETKHGTTMGPESVDVNPSMTLSDLKDDLRESRGIQKRIAIRRDNRNDFLGPDHLTLESLQITNRDTLLFKVMD